VLVDSFEPLRVKPGVLRIDLDFELSHRVSSDELRTGG
jgi:hypothetical protein